jgi:ribosomal protein L13E
MRPLRIMAAISLALLLLHLAAAGAQTASLQPIGDIRQGARQEVDYAPAPPEGGGINYAQALFIGIKVQRRWVPRGKRAVLTVWVSPCTGRKSKSVELLRNGHPNGTRFLSRACTARFLRRVHRDTTFTAAVTEEADLLASESRRLTIRIDHHGRR